MSLPVNIIKTINGSGQLYEVGGAVRDRLRYAMSLDTGEIDPVRFWRYRPGETDYLVTGMPMDELAAILERFGHVELVGKTFGVLKFKLQIEDRAALGTGTGTSRSSTIRTCRWRRTCGGGISPSTPSPCELRVASCELRNQN
jgi:tRNA nucleotidyltransferase/poly(A) polymerase